MKESPRWLLSKGRVEDAYRVVFKKKLDDTELSEKLHLAKQSDAIAEVSGYYMIISRRYIVLILCPS